MSTILDFTPLHPALAHGTVAIGMFSLLSALAFVFVASRCIRLVVLPFLRHEQGVYTAPENLLFRTHIGHYVGNLILASVFVTVAGLMEFNWGAQSGISRGSSCFAQAIMMQIGLWSSSYFTIATGAHTCTSLVFRARQVPWVNSVCIALGWIISLVVALVPHVKDNIYGPDGISCGVLRQYHVEYLLLQSLPIFLGIAFSGAIYCLIFFVLYGKLGHRKGVLKVNQGSHHRWSLMDNSSEYIRFIAVLAQTMFWYPFAFTVLLLPFCIVHLLVYSGYSVSGAGDIFANICCSMLGLVNVGLLYNTFRVVSPLFRASSPAVKVAVEAEKSFGHTASKESLLFPQTTPMASVLDLAPDRDDLGPSFHPTHCRSTSESSTDSTVQLLGVKRKSSKYNAMRVRQGAHHLVSPPPVLNKGMTEKKVGLTIIIPEPPLAASPSPPLVTVRLSDAPRLPSPPSVESESDEESPYRQSVDPQPKNRSFKARAPSPLNLSEELEQFPPVPLSAYLVSNKSATLASNLGLPSATQSPAPRFVVPLPTDIGTSPQFPHIRLDKGKGKAPPPPETPVPRIGITASDPGSSRVRSSTRPLPHLPEGLDSDGSNNYVGSRTSYLSLGSSSSDLEHEYGYFPGAPPSHCARPLPTVPASATWEEDVTDGELPPTPLPVSRSTTPASVERRCPPSRRTTTTSVWSQESAWSRSQPPDVEYVLEYRRLTPNALIPGLMRGDQASVGAVPFAERRIMLPAGARPFIARPLRPGKIASRFAQAIKSPITPQGFTMVNVPNDSAV